MSFITWIEQTEHESHWMTSPISSNLSVFSKRPMLRTSKTLVTRIYRAKESRQRRSGVVSPKAHPPQTVLVSIATLRHDEKSSSVAVRLLLAVRKMGSCLSSHFKNVCTYLHLQLAHNSWNRSIGLIQLVICQSLTVCDKNKRWDFFQLFTSFFQFVSSSHCSDVSSSCQLAIF